MKTITISENSYSRLKSWKKGGRDSFSKVIERMIPEKGTLGAVLDYLDKREGASDEEKDQKMEQSLNERAVGQTDPWNF